MAESDQEFSSSTSKEDMELSDSVEDNVVLTRDQVFSYQGQSFTNSNGNGKSREDDEGGVEGRLTPALLEC